MWGWGGGGCRVMHCVGGYYYIYRKLSLGIQKKKKKKLITTGLNYV